MSSSLLLLFLSNLNLTGFFFPLIFLLEHHVTTRCFQLSLSRSSFHKFHWREEANVKHGHDTPTSDARQRMNKKKTNIANYFVNLTSFLTLSSPFSSSMRLLLPFVFPLASLSFFEGSLTYAYVFNKWSFTSSEHFFLSLLRLACFIVKWRRDHRRRRRRRKLYERHSKDSVLFLCVCEEWRRKFFSLLAPNPPFSLSTTIIERQACD